MIKVKARIENETAKPSEVIETKFGSLFNGTEFIYFESDEERIEYLSKLDVDNGYKI